MPAAIAIPLIASGISAGGSLGAAYMGSRAANSAQKNAAQRSPEELALIKSQTGLADQQRRQGSALFAGAMPGINKSLDYYKTLLSGDRAAQTAAVAPEAETIGQAYSGADKAVRRQLVGGERDQALAENSRARAGQISRLITGQRPAAAQGVAGLSAGLLGESGGFSGNAANITANLLGNETQNRQQANQVGRETGQNTTEQLGALIARLLGTSFRGSGGRGGTLPSRTTMPPYQVTPPGNSGGTQFSY